MQVDKNQININISRMEDITLFFIQLIEQSKSLDIAEAEFKRLISEDEDLHREYSEWCRSQGTNEKHGFHDFCDEYLDSQDDIWNQLRDYDDQDM